MNIVILTNDNFFSFKVLEKSLSFSKDDIKLMVFSSALIGKRDNLASIIWSARNTGFRHTMFKLTIYGISKIMKNICKLLPFLKNHYSSFLWAKQNNIKCFNSKNIKEHDVVEQITAARPDLIISVSMNQIVKREILAIPPKRSINVHCAPLPRYRGMSPYVWVLANNEDHSAATIHYMEESVDTGDIIAQEKIAVVKNDSAFCLFYRCCIRAGEMLLETIKKIENNSVDSYKQDESQQSYYSWPTRKCVASLHKNGYKLAKTTDFTNAIFKQQPRIKNRRSLLPGESSTKILTFTKKLNMSSNENIYMHVLKKQGRHVFSIEGIDWLKYKHFIAPAYFPHCLPAISTANVEKVLTRSGTFFARWESEFGEIQQGEWWHVIRKGPWDFQECSKNTRRKIHRGRKKLYAEIVSPEIIASKGYAVCQKASKRYKTPLFFPDVDSFQKKVLSAQTYPENFQFFGVFSGTELVAFCENYLQENAVLWDIVWYDPQYLRNYSSYVLIDAMLNYYLNELKVLYVSAGNRSIYHKTNVQDFMIQKFGFIKEYAVLNVEYSTLFKYVIRAICFLSPSLHLMNKHSNTVFLHRLEGLSLQEKIRKSYLK